MVSSDVCGAGVGLGLAVAFDFGVVRRWPVRRCALTSGSSKRVADNKSAAQISSDTHRNRVLPAGTFICLLLIAVPISSLRSLCVLCASAVK